MNNKKVFFTYVRNESGNIALNRVCIVDTNSMKIDAEKFDIDKHGDLFKNFMVNGNITGEALVSELEEKGLFNEADITAEKLRTYISSDNSFEIETTETINENESIENSEQNENSEEIETPELTGTDEFTAEDEYVESDEEKDYTTSKRVVAAILAAGATVGALSLMHSCQQEQIIEETQTQTLEDLLNQMTPEQKAFFETSFKAVETFNNNAIKEGNFALDKDQSALHMTVDEAVALNIVLNDYSSDELYEVFGTVKFDTANIMNLARSAYGKLSTYYMNAKEASGISSMIRDEVARNFFEKHENAIIDFNNNPSVELSDNVIKGMYNDYTYDGSNGEYAKINNDGVAWLATSPVFGYELANRNIPEFLKTRDGLVLNKITSNELLNGINEEINVDIIDELDMKSLCATVTSQTKGKIDALTMRQSITSTIVETNAKDELVEGLKEFGNINLANKVLASDITADLLQEISRTNSKANELVDEYKARISSLEEKEAKILATLNLAKDKYNSKEEIDLADLVNNRFRSPLVVEKQPVVDNTPGVTTEEEKKEQLKEELYVGEDKDGTPVYDGDKLEELPQEEKEEFIKDNGVVVEQETTVVEKEEVKFEDLTPAEKEEVIDQTAVLEEIELLKNQLITDGVYDAIDYTEEVGAYKYNGTLVIPYNGQELDTNTMSLFNIAAYDAAFGGRGIDDNQIQTRINNDATKVEKDLNSLSGDAVEYLEDKYGSNWKEDFIEESYKYGYNEQIKGSLAEAIKLAPQLKQMAEDEYNKAQAGVNNMNASEKVENNTSNDYDPNLDSNHTMKDEEPYIPSFSIETPGEYVPESTTETTSSTFSEYDPNLDQNYSMPDEEPYIPSFSIEVPGEYVSDEQLENAFNTAMSEGSTSKGK